MGVFTINTSVKHYSYILQYSSVEGDVCSITTSDDVTVYQTVNTFSFNEPIFKDSGGFEYSIAGWYSDGFSYREWSGASWLGTGTTSCPQ